MQLPEKDVKKEHYLATVCKYKERRSNDMKKFKKVILLILIFTFCFLIGCRSENTINKKEDVREIVWKQLSTGEKDEIIGSWKDGVVVKTIATSNSYLLIDKSFEEKEVYFITFKSEKEPILGNVQKLVDIKSNKIVGVNLRV